MCYSSSQCVLLVTDIPNRLDLKLNPSLLLLSLAIDLFRFTWSSSLQQGLQFLSITIFCPVDASLFLSLRSVSALTCKCTGLIRKAEMLLSLFMLASLISPYISEFLYSSKVGTCFYKWENSSILCLGS